MAVATQDGAKQQAQVAQDDAGGAGMRIMSERRFQEELAKAKEEIYQREQADRKMMEIHQRIDAIQRELFELRCKVDGPAEKCATTTEMHE